MAKGRMLRDTTTSKRVNELSWKAEVLFYRLMMKADDFGSYFADVTLMRTDLFPYRLKSVKEAHISEWMEECRKLGLLVIYTHSGKPYLRILNFGQRLRNMRNKFPDPPKEILEQLAATRSEMTPEEELEDEVEQEQEVELEGSAPPSTSFSLEKFEIEIKKAFNQIEAAARRNKTTPEKILSMIPDFIDTCRIKAKTNETWLEYCNYFSNWLLTEFSKQKNDKGFSKKGGAHSDAELADGLQKRFNQQ